MLNMLYVVVGTVQYHHCTSRLKVDLDLDRSIFIIALAAYMYSEATSLSLASYSREKRLPAASR